MMTVLAPIFRGEWAPYGAALSCASPPPSAVPLSELIASPALLRQALAAHGRQCGSDAMRPVASAWSRHYLDALLPPVVVAATLLRHRFELAPARLLVDLDAAGAVQRFYLPDQGRPYANAELPGRYRQLLDAHLAPLFGALAALSGVPLKILWGNAARYIDSVLSHAAPLEPRLGHPGLVASDRHALLDNPLSAASEPNPLYTRRRRATLNVDGATVTHTLHRQCCLVYLLPGREFCECCPLDPRYSRST
ncbi:ferric iron reductase protein FhuF [Duganella sp. SG902]|uniref:siderophore-iron reductase FhuF n=1 Tax=Duganella sp. SG902 TaxID=2587016 RepID=UPI00159D898B|nr:siderophore-iron reductase FhuF [Duganella sp. SG902]NVM79152.1 ferric iron reductase protein FhuF [Duganella sp. SG902]